MNMNITSSYIEKIMLTNIIYVYNEGFEESENLIFELLTILGFYYIKSSNPRYEEKDPRFEDIKNEKLSMKNNFFSKKTMIFIFSDLFFVYKMKIPKKWQIPLR